MSTRTPAEAWAAMTRGNERFVSGNPAHPRQDVEQRAALLSGQVPTAALFGCSDSRLSAEIIFDQGLGDLFVVRNAGQVISTSVVGSLEYAVAVLGVPLILVLAHDNCGAINGAISTLAPKPMELPVHVKSHVESIVPAVRRIAGAQGLFSPDGTLDVERIDSLEVGREHLKDTIKEMLESSELISDAVANGNLAIVGANYRLGEGLVSPDIVVGVID